MNDGIFSQELESVRPWLIQRFRRFGCDAVESEDLVQDTLIRAWRARGTYDGGRGRIRTWVQQIALRVYLDTGRKKRVPTVADADTADELGTAIDRAPSNEPNPCDQLISDDITRRVLCCIEIDRPEIANLIRSVMDGEKFADSTARNRLSRNRSYCQAVYLGMTRQNPTEERLADAQREADSGS